jgi:hypothetical protein
MRGADKRFADDFSGPREEKNSIKTHENTKFPNGITGSNSLPKYTPRVLTRDCFGLRRVKERTK